MMSSDADDRSRTTSRARELVGRARTLLLDFDGPLAALMPPPVPERAAAHVRAAAGHLVLPDQIAGTTDHLAVLRHVLREHPESVLGIEEACTEAEVEAADAAEPGVHADELISYARRHGLPTAIVSNNSPRAVWAFLERHGWADAIDVCVGRGPDNAGRMKPHPDFLVLARARLGLDDAPTVFIGDTVSDVLAGRAARIPVVALARHAQRAVELHDAGADAVVRFGDSAALLPAS